MKKHSDSEIKINKEKHKGHKSNIVFEINDSKDHEYGTGTIAKNFKEFLETLGFKIKPSQTGVYRNHEDVTIDGISFRIEYGKVSIMCDQAFTRTRTVRKERSVEIYDKVFDKTVVARVRFNVDIDHDKLVSKIESAIALRKANELEIKNRENSKKVLLKKMRDHYYCNKVMSKNIKSISLHQGVISISIKQGCINIDSSTGKITSFEPDQIHSMDISKIMEYNESVSESVSVAIILSHEIEMRVGHLNDPEFMAFSKDAYYCRVDNKTIEG
jgi:hypothetical protein